MGYLERLRKNKKTNWEFVLIVIGFYGNWYFDFVKEIGDLSAHIGLIVLGIISVISLFLFFLEMCYITKSFVGRFRLGLILSSVHMLSTALVLIWKNLLFQFVWVTGIVLWGIISGYEARVSFASIMEEDEDD
jgi:hypothetical protein